MHLKVDMPLLCKPCFSSFFNKHTKGQLRSTRTWTTSLTFCSLPSQTLTFNMKGYVLERLKCNLIIEKALNDEGGF